MSEDEVPSRGFIFGYEGKDTLLSSIGDVFVK